MDSTVFAFLSTKNGCGVKGLCGCVCNMTDRWDVNKPKESHRHTIHLLSPHLLTAMYRCFPDIYVICSSKNK